MQNPFDQQTPIPGVKYIVAVGSGKGGVGKSTVAANLAVALSNTGAKVGLLDADIYGPSLPRLFGMLNQKPSIGEDRKIQPLRRSNIALMSMGFLVDENSALIWRGPMLFKAMEQFFRDIAWGDLDYLLIDLPPGTGDVQLTVVQKVPLAGAIAVTTPQNIALMDVKKAIDMFKRVNVPILGVVENMSAFQAEDAGPAVNMFPKGELEAYLKKEGLRKLAELPFYPPLSQACEIGIPLVEMKPESNAAKEFGKIAAFVREALPL